MILNEYNKLYEQFLFMDEVILHSFDKIPISITVNTCIKRIKQIPYTKETSHFIYSFLLRSRYTENFTLLFFLNNLLLQLRLHYSCVFASPLILNGSANPLTFTINWRLFFTAKRFVYLAAVLFARCTYTFQIHLHTFKAFFHFVLRQKNLVWSPRSGHYESLMLIKNFCLRIWIQCKTRLGKGGTCCSVCMQWWMCGDFRNEKKMCVFHNCTTALSCVLIETSIIFIAE